MGERVMMLVTSLETTNEVEKNQTFLRQLFKGRKVPFVEFDGADQKNKEERDRLFDMSQKRGGYPQVFIEGPSGTRYVGDFVDVVGMADNEDYPPEILAKNPQIVTFDQFFKPFCTQKVPLKELSENDNTPAFSFKGISSFASQLLSL